MLSSLPPHGSCIGIEIELQDAEKFLCGSLLCMTSVIVSRRWSEIASGVISGWCNTPPNWRRRAPGRSRQDGDCQDRADAALGCSRRASSNRGRLTIGKPCLSQVHFSSLPYRRRTSSWSVQAAKEFPTDLSHDSGVALSPENAPKSRSRQVIRFWPSMPEPSPASANS